MKLYNIYLKIISKKIPDMRNLVIVSRLINFEWLAILCRSMKAESTHLHKETFNQNTF